jgi:predicted ribosome quality control (RQC) complex YloA/Tae2 family protein
MSSASLGLDRRALILRALRRHHARLSRKTAGLLADVAEARGAPELRASAETLLAYLRQVPPRAERVVLPDLHDSGRNREIALDPKVAPQANAARYFKRAAKAERGLKEIPPRLAATQAERHALEVLIERARALEEGAADSARPDDPALDAELESALAQLPPAIRRAAGVEPAVPRTAGPRAQRARPAVPARLQPRRLRTTEGWDVIIGRSNEGNDYVTHQLARSEDYWLHVHGAAGSHVVIRRGKGANEPSKRTIEEVAAWAAFYS